MFYILTFNHVPHDFQNAYSLISEKPIHMRVLRLIPLLILHYICLILIWLMYTTFALSLCCLSFSVLPFLTFLVFFVISCSLYSARFSTASCFSFSDIFKFSGLSDLCECLKDKLKVEKFAR